MVSVSSPWSQQANMGTTREEQESCTEVRVIDSQLQHFRNYFDILQVYKCRLCNFCSPHEHVIASHMSEVHFPRRCFLCKQCLFVFEDRAQLASHLDSAHGSQSIVVCFGESGSYTNSPPVWSMANRMGSEGREQSLQSTDSTEEVRPGETRNGRVSSSTGNLANAARERPNHSVSLERSASSGLVSGEDQHGNIVNASEGNLERMQSAGSICHPSTTTRFCESTETDSNHAHLSHESSLENQNDMEHSPEQVASPTPGAQRPDNHSRGMSIKLEPVSPAIGMPSGGSRGSLSEDGDGENNEITIEDSDGIEIIHSDSPPIPRSSTVEAADKPNGISTGTHPWRQNSLTPSESGGRGVLRRQATVDLPDCENEEDESRGSGIDVSEHDSSRGHSRSQEDVVHDERAVRRDSPNGHMQHGEHSTGEKKNLQQSPIPQQPDVYPPATLRDLVSRGREGGLHTLGHERSVLETSRSMEINSEPQPMSRSVRVRSHSISEGEISQNPEARPLVKEYPHQTPPAAGGTPRVPSIQVSQHLPVPSYWPHGYHGLVYQPRSWDGDASSMYRSLAPPGHHNHPDYRGGPIRSRSEEVPSILPSSGPPPTEDSVLYKYLQKGGKPKRNIGRPTLSGSSHSADADMSHPGYYMPGMGDITRRQLHHPMMIPWPPNGSLQSHGSFGLYHDQSAASPGSQASGSGQPSPEGYRYHRGLDLRNAESSQDLAHVDDITRQVQRAVGGASSLYGSEHPMVAHNEGSPSHSSREEDEVGAKDGEGSEVKKRSRKSTFNIYREIPERKRKLDRDEEERIKHSYNPDGSFDYFSLTGWKAYKCALCKKRRFKTASELEEHKQSKHPNEGDLLRRQSPVPPPGAGPSMVQERAFSPATNG
ncbi:uncharacterized protein [Apostichopus japonicus]|uniref:uncharacterized protein n=1 Tax=Stichopus japonicus TaxID=307972 RepID=UPI003AB70819